MPRESRIDVDLTKLRKAFDLAAGHGFWVLLRTRSADEELLLDAFAGAGADADADADAFAGAQSDDGVRSVLAARTTGGYVSVLERAQGFDDVVAWCDHLVARLAGSGVDGTLTAAPKARLPIWLLHDDPYEDTASSPPSVYTHMGCLAWSFDERTLIGNPRWPAEWGVDAEATSRICELVTTWASDGGPQALLRRNVSWRAVSQGPDLARFLASAISATGMAGLQCYTEASHRCFGVGMTSIAETVLRINAPGWHWQPRIENLKAVFVDAADLLDVAFVRPLVRTSAGSWDTIGHAVPLPGVAEWQLRDNKHLLATHTPDAHGIQILRDAHLERAHDLSDWSITDLGDGRHLVEARDLEPWYGQPLPDPDTLAQARLDFGSTILTAQAIADHPAPWNLPPT